MADQNVTVLWLKRKANWELLVALRDADREFGAHREASRVWDEASQSAEERFGTLATARQRPEEKQTLATAWDALSAAETAWYSDYVHPADVAAAELVMTPAPDLAAVLLKARVVKEHELDNYVGLSSEPMSIILADVQRLNLTKELA